MRIIKITFHEQTHARCRGYAADDHIASSTYEIAGEDETLNVVLPLVNKIEDLVMNRATKTVQNWKKNNSGECPPEEFLGQKWVSFLVTEENARHSDLNPAEPVIKDLQALAEELAA